MQKSPRSPQSLEAELKFVHGVSAVLCQLEHLLMFLYPSPGYRRARRRAQGPRGLYPAIRENSPRIALDLLQQIQRIICSTHARG